MKTDYVFKRISREECCFELNEEELCALPQKEREVIENKRLLWHLWNDLGGY